MPPPARHLAATAAAAAVLALAFVPARATAADHRCAGHAVAQAKKLVRFHYGEDQFINDATRARTVAPVKALVGKSTFDVLEVVSDVYKTQYRMRFIYARIPGECTLMGQEVFEMSDPG